MTDRRDPGTGRARRFATGLLATAAALAALLTATPAPARPRPVRITLTAPEGERTVEAADLRFAFFHTRYRRMRAPVEESPTRERLEVLNDRDDCACLRLADYSRVRFSILREIEVRTAPGDKVASVRVTHRDGKMQEYPADKLYGGDGLAPPLFMVTVDGVAREFPLILPEDADWPAEMLVRALLTPPPRKGTPR